MFRVRFPHPSHDTLRYCPAWQVSGHWAKLSQRNNKTFSALTARLTVNSQPTYRVPEFLTKTKCRLYNCPGSATHRLVKLAQWLFHLLDAFRSVWIFNVAAIGTRSVWRKYFSYSHWTNRYRDLLIRAPKTLLISVSPNLSPGLKFWLSSMVCYWKEWTGHKHNINTHCISCQRQSQNLKPTWHHQPKKNNKFWIRRCLLRAISWVIILGGQVHDWSLDIGHLIAGQETQDWIEGVMMFVGQWIFGYWRIYASGRSFNQH